jgi:hypothetical protein
VISHASKSLRIRASHLFTRDPPQDHPDSSQIARRLQFLLRPLYRNCAGNDAATGVGAVILNIKIGRFYGTVDINDSPVESSKKLPCQNIDSR